MLDIFHFLAFLASNVCEVLNNSQSALQFSQTFQVASCHAWLLRCAVLMRSFHKFSQLTEQNMVNAYNPLETGVYAS